MMKVVLFGGAAVLALAVPAIAQLARPEPAAQTRAQAESKVREHFTRFDTNGDAVVTRDELDAFAGAARDKAMDDRFASMDSDKNGSISRTEFDAGHGQSRGRMMRHGDMAMAPVPPAPPEPGLAPPTPPKPPRFERRMRMMSGPGGGMMTLADANRDGRITLKEATEAALARFDKADANHDGTLTTDERRAAREAMRDARRSGRGG